MSRTYAYSIVPGFFLQDESNFDYTTHDFVSHSFGLLDTSSSRWSTFRLSIDSLNASAPVGTTYKVLYIGRHGQGAHNVAETRYGTPLWDSKWSLLTGDGESVWGPDPPLTAVGIDQARALKAAWEAEIEAGIPLPQALYASPFTRVAETLRLSIGEIMVEGLGLRPMVLEGLRETIGLHTCDERSPKSVVQEAFPELIFEEGFSEPDVLWTKDRQETLPEHTIRTQLVLDQLFSTDSSTYLSITAHSGTLKSFFCAMHRTPYLVPPGGLLPVVVKAVAVSHL